MSTILVPVDFSAETPEVIECAAMLARRNRSRLVLLHVAPAGADAADDAAARLARLENYLREDGFQVSVAVRSGEPAREIVELGGSLQADCIIIGRHDHAGAAAGQSAVTTSVEQQASCAVVAVP
jgi:nucleotide-binding universal stress UspA family protein